MLLQKAAIEFALAIGEFEGHIAHRGALHLGRHLHQLQELWGQLGVQGQEILEVLFLQFLVRGARHSGNRHSEPHFGILSRRGQFLGYQLTFRHPEGIERDLQPLRSVDIEWRGRVLLNQLNHSQSKDPEARVTHVADR